MLPDLLGATVRVRAGDVVATGVLTEVADGIFVLRDRRHLLWPFPTAAVSAVFVVAP